MHPLESLWQKGKRLVIGLMSGTSVDGIDAVLTEISGFGRNTRVRQLDFCFTPFAPEIRQKILSIASGDSTTAEEICKLKTLLGILYSEACLDLCRHAGISPADIDLVGCHGQTIWHSPQKEPYLGREFAATLQIGEDAVIAQALGCPVVGDFRVRDVAAGGQGAPLVPYAEFLLYREPNRCTALQNIGGIGNVTILPAGCGYDDVVAFDTGPGNMIMDVLTRRLTDGRQSYDIGGKLAAAGRISQPLLAWMMDDPYLDQIPPKTTGRERYGPAYIDALLAQAEVLELPMDDVLATATRFTAETIAYALKKFASVFPERLVVTGGGCWNETLMAHLRRLLPGCVLLTGEDLGFSSDAKEAIAFAVLANEAAFGICNNVPVATGAAGPIVMGKLSI